MLSFDEAFQGWARYAEETRDRPPRPLLRQALEFTSKRTSALDIGAGALNDARFLLEAGFASVTALDAEPVAQAVADGFPPDRFQYRIATFETFDFAPATYDLVNAQYALPFIDPAHFDRVFTAILSSLRPEGIFAGQLFGDRDDWAGTEGMTFHSLADARALFSGCSLFEFAEEDDPDGRIASGKPKHWHAFHFIARRKPDRQEMPS